MMSREQNDQFSRVGPGTFMGKLLRRYWAPFLLASEIPEPDCPPVRVKLMGEDLVCFGDSKGKIGLIDEFCARGGVWLWLGRNEDCGVGRASRGGESVRTRHEVGLACEW